MLRGNAIRKNRREPSLIVFRCDTCLAPVHNLPRREFVCQAGPAAPGQIQQRRALYSVLLFQRPSLHLLGMMEKLLAALTIMSTIFILTWLLRWLKPFPPAAPPSLQKKHRRLRRRRGSLPMSVYQFLRAASHSPMSSRRVETPRLATSAIAFRRWQTDNTLYCISIRARDSTRGSKARMMRGSGDILARE